MLTVCVGLVVIGGIQRISKVSQVVVPFMAVLYVVLALIIMVTHITAIPGAIVTIVKSAFTGSALAGGAMAVSYTHLDVYKRQEWRYGSEPLPSIV